MQPRDTISTAISAATARGAPALVGFLTAGFPTRRHFRENLARRRRVVRCGGDRRPVLRPDGGRFHHPARELCRAGRGGDASLDPRELAALPRPLAAPMLLMSYLNPLLAFGLEALPRAAREAGVAGFIVPDLPHEESGDLATALEREGLALVQMVTPVTPDSRLAMLCAAAQGFVYAVTMTGTTGKSVEVPDEVLAYMDRVKRYSKVPVCAGFGIRSHEQVTRFAKHVDGVVVGSALVETLERGGDVRAFLGSLRG